MIWPPWQRGLINDVDNSLLRRPPRCGPDPPCDWPVIFGLTTSPGVSVPEVSYPRVRLSVPSPSTGRAPYEKCDGDGTGMEPPRGAHNGHPWPVARALRGRVL
jgi:hypothetical protein